MRVIFGMLTDFSCYLFRDKWGENGHKRQFHIMQILNEFSSDLDGFLLNESFWKNAAKFSSLIQLYYCVQQNTCALCYTLKGHIYITNDSKLFWFYFLLGTSRMNEWIDQYYGENIKFGYKNQRQVFLKWMGVC